MDSTSQLAACRLEAGPVSPTASHGLSSLGVSSLVHATLALLGIAVGLTETARLQVPAGQTPSQQTIVLSAAFSPPPTVLTTLPPRGLETAQPTEPSETVQPVELPDIPPLPDPELPAMPTAASRGAADATPQLLDEPVAPVEPVEATPPASETAQAVAATAADAPGAKLERSARPLPTNLPPAYPPAAIAEDRQGRVMLRVVVDAHGAAAKVTVLRSSGHEDLDQAAIAAVSQWRFTPARQDNAAVQQTIAVPIRFTKQL